MKRPLTHIVAALFIALAVMPPHIARAQEVVSDPVVEVKTALSSAYDFVTSQASNLVANKELTLDPIAWAVAKAAIASMTQSMVNWINTGFNGSPAFVTNIQAFIGNGNYATANSFTTQLGTNPAVSSPFQTQVATLLKLNYLQSSNSNGFFLQNPYTLNQVSSNPTGFVSGATNFSSGGGWNAWFALTTQPQNNVYGAYNLAQAELNNRVGASQSNALTQLGWGQGFMSWCGDGTGGGGGTNQGGVCKTDDDCAGALACISGKCAVDASLVNPASTCTNKDGSTGKIQTPGSVIQAQINHTLGLSGDTLVTADEFNEIIGALMGQLVNKVVGAVGLGGNSAGQGGIQSVDYGGTGAADAATTQQATTTAASADTTLTNAITQQIAQIHAYQADWQSIGSEAASAQTALGSCPLPPADAATAVATTTAQSASAVARATNAIAALTNVGTEISAAGSDSTAISQAANDYQTVIASTTTPSATDLAYADFQAQNESTSGSSGPLTSLTLYAQMQRIISECALPVLGR